MTRELVWSAAVSLDLYLAGPEEALDWLRWGDDAAAISGGIWQDADTLLMGRKTYDFAARSGGGDAGESKIRTFIFSRAMAEAPKGAELVREDAAGFVRAQASGGRAHRPDGRRRARRGADRGRRGRRDRAQRPPGPARRRRAFLPAAGAADRRLAGRGPVDRQRLLYLRYRLA